MRRQVSLAITTIPVPSLTKNGALLWRILRHVFPETGLLSGRREFTRRDRWLLALAGLGGVDARDVRRNELGAHERRGGSLRMRPPHRQGATGRKEGMLKRVNRKGLAAARAKDPFVERNA